MKNKLLYFTKITYLFVFLTVSVCISAQTVSNKSDEKAEAIIKRAVENLGGEKYLQVKSQIGRGKYHIMRDGAMVSYQTKNAPNLSLAA
jgi:hypothetical protein